MQDHLPTPPPPSGITISCTLGRARLDEVGTIELSRQCLPGRGCWYSVCRTYEAGVVSRSTGKTMQGSRGQHRRGRHLVAAFDHTTGVVAVQRTTEAKSNESPALRDPLVGVDTQHTTACWIISQGGDCLLAVTDNQPRFEQQLAALLWGTIPSHTTAGTSHGRCAT